MQTLTADALLDCYRNGVFPMAEDRRDRRVFLVEPAERGVIPLDEFRIPKRLARTIRSRKFEIRVDTAFADVISACAAPGPGREQTWISFGLEELYLELFRRGYAHSVEAWREGRLAGGLYGVAIGAAFFGESMFSRERDASKVALVALVERLRACGFVLLDTQFVTRHLIGLGAVAIDRRAYLARLAQALSLRAEFRAA